MPTTAPTRDMRIAHAALRRDLARARWILSGPYGRRRLTAVGRRLARVADEVHHHHTGEDEVMWPELLRREPSLGALHERMSADHEAVHAPLDRLREVGLGLAAGTASPADALTAIDELDATLLPHLAREESEAMPEVDRLLTDDEWRDLAHRAWVEGSSPGQMAANGLWVINGQHPEDVRQFLRVVPAPVQLALRAVFGPGYALGNARLWGMTPAARIPALGADDDPAPRRLRWSLTPQGEQTAVVPATPAQVFAVLADPTRTPEWSHEVEAVTWAPGRSVAEPGAEFAGTSRVGRIRWTATSRFHEVVPERRVSFFTVSRTGSTLWTYDLEPVDGGTRITQRYRILALWRLREIPLYWLVREHHDRSDALAGDLVRLGQVTARVD